jgi:hypothetical protein
MVKRERAVFILIGIRVGDYYEEEGDDNREI